MIDIPDYPGFDPEMHIYHIKRGNSRGAWLSNRPIAKAVFEDLQFICDMTKYETPEEVLGDAGLKDWLRGITVHRRGESVLATFDLESWEWRRGE